MPKLSVCIPVEPDQAAPSFLVDTLLARSGVDLEVIVSLFESSQDSAAALYEKAASDPRLTILPPAPANITAAQLWIGTVNAAKGDWVTIVAPDDMLDPDLAKLIAHVEETRPTADAIGWNSFQISPTASRGTKTAVAIPVQHKVSEIDKASMLDAFFNWTAAPQTPKVPFGLFHGALKRSLVESILSASAPTSWLTPVPRFEWTARTVLFANELALSHRPMSATSTTPYRPVAVRSALEGFPLDGSIGLTAAIAEIQARVLSELGSEWGGFNENFVRSCSVDCILEHDPAVFEQRCQGYHAALQRMPGGEQLLPYFQPKYYPEQPDDRRRGLVGQTLLVDRFIGNAQTAQEFYSVVSSILAPIFVITDQKAPAKEA
ncbi:glycosyltransferase family 2 protein [Rhizobium halophytocola]|uniref:Glycosyltransferase n=1 Tax=Rhizobium halophytocola TaxID=735519 RepID=A0ABS4E0P3_9HYPH|nr:glycosyltransferase family A protein [Rhizobium halophytocola]MBP1851513.1 hypothetical protein [Rhizobium halophytocola]